MTPQSEKLLGIALSIEGIAKDIGDGMEQLEKSNSVEPVAHAYWALSEAYKALDAARLKVYHHKDRFEKQLFPSFMERMGVDKVRVPELERSFYILQKYSAKQHDKEKAMDWLREHGGEDLISETVNSGTLAKFLQDYINSTGVEPDPEVMELTTYNTIGSSKYTPK